MNEEQGAASAANSGPSTHSDLMHFMALVARNATETDLRFKQEQEIYQRNSSINEYARFLVNENQQLRDENQRLKSELAEAQSQIFKLQPYIKDITPDEAGSVSAKI